MRIGIRTAQNHRLATPAAVRSAAIAAEQVGYSSLWVVGEAPGNGLGPTEALSAAAAVTTRLRLGAGVDASGWRPGALARSLAGLDVLSDGRLDLALVAEPVDLRAVERDLDDLDAAWPARDSPRPRPPLLLTDACPTGLLLAARRADGLSPLGVPIPGLAGIWQRVRSAAAEAGRDPDALRLVVRADLTLYPSPQGGGRGPFCGDLDEIASDLDGCRAAGASEVVLGLTGDEDLDEALAAYARVAELLELPLH
jgi:alkanesulfonate monooxygenase SsuD/methylene tetrahydromethanopterin reductase-like flavin-dependent oxidoreductase (luciferase family)